MARCRIFLFLRGISVVYAPSGNENDLHVGSLSRFERAAHGSRSVFGSVLGNPKRNRHLEIHRISTLGLKSFEGRCHRPYRNVGVVYEAMPSLKELAQKARDSRPPVTILDRDSRPIAIGVIDPDTTAVLWKFWLSEPANPVFLSDNAAFLRHSDGRTIEIFDFRPCVSQYKPRHFDFQVRLPKSS